MMAQLKPRITPKEARERLGVLREWLMKNRFCTETILGDTEKAAKVITDLKIASRELLEAQPSILAVCLAGSRVTGCCSDQSDADIVIVARRYDDLFRSPFEGRSFLEERQTFLQYCLFLGRRSGLGLSIDVGYQDNLVRDGLCSMHKSMHQTFVLMRQFILSAKSEYFEKMNERFRSYERELDKIQGIFERVVLQSEGRMGDLFLHKLSKRSGLSVSEVEGIFDWEYRMARRTQGIVSIESEISRLCQEQRGLVI
ncbi:hypothetical protein HY988_02310 [Candidatus Micrarchaeota archaeon]|nr:hypothetical protein [Candidatus Micrarchaeota archaeon]